MNLSKMKKSGMVIVMVCSDVSFHLDELRHIDTSLDCVLWSLDLVSLSVGCSLPVRSVHNFCYSGFLGSSYHCIVEGKF